MSDVSGIRGVNVIPSGEPNPNADNYKDFIPSRQRMEARYGKPVQTPEPGIPDEVKVVLPGERDFVDADSIAKLKAQAMQTGRTRDQERKADAKAIAKRKAEAKEVLDNKEASGLDLKYAKSALDGPDGEDIDHMIERLRKDWA